MKKFKLTEDNVYWIHGDKTTHTTHKIDADLREKAAMLPRKAVLLAMTEFHNKKRLTQQ